MIRKRLTPKQAFWRRQNKKTKACRDKYYEERREEHNVDMRRRQVMAAEAGRAYEHLKNYEKRKKEKLLNSDKRIEVDGVVLYGERYAYKNMIKNLKFYTLYGYRGKRIIPKAIYVKKDGKREPMHYLSKRQIDLINYAWKKGSKMKSLGEKSEYLHKQWTKGEIGFRDESNDND